ncbi:MAG TPA: cupin domain-containing protein [Propionibacteriaceae bacterium]|nr:cupin domain-containing protein [Propionibacteriaceae bacterium]
MAALTAALTAEALGSGVAAAMVALTVEPMVALTVEPMAALTVKPMAALTVEPMAAQMVEPMAALTVKPMVEQMVEPMAAQMVEPMAAQMVEQMAAPFAEDSVLARLIAVDRDRFADQHWGQQPLLSPAADLPGGFPELLNADAIDELVSQRGLRTPFIRVAKSGSTLSDKAFTAPGGVGAGIADQVSDDKLVRLFSEGSTLVLQALHRTWPPILEFCQRLAAELGHPVQANAYVTPPQNQGFSAHYDVHDVFVLQIEGEKQWRVHPPVLESPLRDQPWSDRQAAVEKRAQEPPLLEALLRPGDCLYLPRGYLHAATALGGVSTHLTLGVHVWTRLVLAERVVDQAVRRLAGDPVMRASLPLGVDVADPSGMRHDVELITAALVAAVERADLDQLADSMLQDARRSQRAAPIGPLRQLRDAEALTDDSALVLRDHLVASVDHTRSGIVVRSRAGDVTVTESDVAPLKALLNNRRASAADLGLDLARRLLLAGLVIVE